MLKYHLDAHDGEPVNVAEFAASMVSFIEAFVRGMQYDPLVLERRELEAMTALCRLLSEDLQTLARDLQETGQEAAP